MVGHWVRHLVIFIWSGSCLEKKITNIDASGCKDLILHEQIHQQEGWTNSSTLSGDKSNVVCRIRRRSATYDHYAITVSRSVAGYDDAGQE